jgi:hypothetical protein
MLRSSYPDTLLSTFCSCVPMNVSPLRARRILFASAMRRGHVSMGVTRRVTTSFPSSAACFPRQIGSHRAPPPLKSRCTPSEVCFDHHTDHMRRMCSLSLSWRPCAAFGDLEGTVSMTRFVPLSLRYFRILRREQESDTPTSQRGGRTGPFAEVQRLVRDIRRSGSLFCRRAARNVPQDRRGRPRDGGCFRSGGCRQAQAGMARLSAPQSFWYAHRIVLPLCEHQLWQRAKHVLFTQTGE